jgi:hypothetical protein
MTARNARLVANVIVIAAGGALAFAALSRPGLRRAALRAVPLVLGGAPPWQVAAFLLARAASGRSQEPVAAARARR